MQVSVPSGDGGGGIVKLGALRHLELAPGDVDAVLDRLRRPAEPDSPGEPSDSDEPSDSGEPDKSGEPVESGGPEFPGATIDVLRAFEGGAVALGRPDVVSVARIPASELARFAEALVEVRAERLRGAEEARAAETAHAAAEARTAHETADVAQAVQALNAAVVALRGLALYTGTPPIGMLNLERIEMVPIGIQRGELVATIPLAPGEETAVTHKEWSVTTKEFTTIVTDELEEVSETGVTDNTDLAQSTSSQSQHSNQFNITGTVQGGIPIISGSSTSSFTAQDSESESATESIKHARATTQKASSRSRREHKVTISTTTVTGESETSTRILKNTQKDPIRIDYFSLMRKWRVRLYRYGLRLTYDLVVPEPGAAMRRAYAELDRLHAMQRPFEFTVKPSDVTIEIVDKDGNPAGESTPVAERKPKYLWLAERHGVTVRPYPEEPTPLTPSAHVGTSGGWWFLDLEFEVPGGTRIKEVRLNGQIGKDDEDDKMNFDVIGAHNEPQWRGLSDALIIRDHRVLAPGGVLPFLQGFTGRQKVTFFFHHSEEVYVGLVVHLEHTSAAIEQWRVEVWNALYNAAQTRYFAQQEDIVGRIAAIEDRLTGVDTLTLRREESDEIMKCVLRFILGPDFDFMPDEILKAFVAAGVDVEHGIGFDGPRLGMLPEQWAAVRRHEDLIRFINQAIEWENVVTFLYSYFWDVPPSWPFIRQLRHPDPNRQAFLRAGSARIVLTVRKGWEERWMRFAEGGSIGAGVPEPYLTIAKEIAAYDDRNYPGIPPANPGRAAVHLQDSVYTTFRVDVEPSARPVNIKVAGSAGFVVGLPVVIDAYDERRVQERQLVVAIPDSTHITVARLDFAHEGSQAPVAMLQPGEKGALVAEWHEYTPSSGTDIAVTSNLTSIA
ncbi:hypothetical protein [Nonomuraea antimicrobica]|uniref:hypothetical protein n=1 Tax=Nonomuraea antimicrobica TaxID=561173 RepID=UPI0031E67C56